MFVVKRALEIYFVEQHQQQHYVKLLSMYLVYTFQKTLNKFICLRQGSRQEIFINSQQQYINYDHGKL